MTTFTKEQLIKMIKRNITVMDRYPDLVTAQMDLEVYKIALASLEAEPIGFRCRRNDNLGDWSYVYHREPDDFERKHLVIEGIYAAPPVPVVPEEKPMPNALSMLEREITQLIGDAQEATVTGYELIAEAWRLMDGQDPKTSDWHSKASKYLNSNIVEKVDDDRIEAVKAVLRRLAGNYPVIPDSWISCSERMPDTKTAVLVAVEFDRKGDWRMKWATYIPGHPDANDGWMIPGASWKPSHWMPLPEPPQEVS
ncbi:TPA: DUF551 domain-containing protein [Escherichia coli]|uniref:DUF551 domain-containing protein n=1 Tax=Escherichia coli TaxID=562 RepID=UPI001780F0C6|nr:DUF551 domain-containing protein [Escherichia coli]EBD6603625.1 DUF551 domain-containing protein [Salmonella enterica]EEV0748565.1 DUF551 domain-containing protein [Escherichia coli]EFB7398010.1 DUF551 domain-containing protein [Escherichia coli]EFB7434296.1 DUF551 domain-containing protein [Escherichia coli]EFE3289736.1 DUF551 domain-containing protein [Escherichia coli]